MAASIIFSHPALAELAHMHKQRTLARLQVLELQPRQYIIRPGENCRGLPLVLEGRLRVQILGAGGNQIVLYRLGPLDFCTLSIGCLTAKHPFAAEVLVEEPTRIALLPADLFDHLMQASTAFRQYVLDSYGERVSELMRLVEEIAFQRMDQRLAACLLTHAQDHTVAATHQTLATELGTAREVVSRLLKEFERDELVRLQRGRVTLCDTARLRLIAGETDRID